MIFATGLRAARCLFVLPVVFSLACSANDEKTVFDGPPRQEQAPKKTTLAAFTGVSDPWVKKLVVGGRPFVSVPDAPDCASDLGIGRVELTDAELEAGSVPYTITYGDSNGFDATTSGTLSLAGITRETCNAREIILQNGQLTFGAGSIGTPDGGVGIPDARAGIPDGGAGLPDSGMPTGDRYLIYGVVWVPASIDCAEGSAFFSDWKAWYAQVADGPYSSTYSAARETLLSKMKAENPGAREYHVESSYFVYGKSAQQLVAVGYGVTYDEALTRAKAHMGASASAYSELHHASW
jgi:hypothetical protein